MSDNPSLEPADKFYNTSEESEPVKPTEEAAVTPPEDQLPDDKELDAPAKAEELEAKNDDGDALFVEIDGEEHNLEDVKSWRDGHMMQSDYTKKTQTLAEERKSFETERDSDRETLLSEKTSVNSMRDELEVLVTEDEEINWAELKEDDPDRYIELKERADKRKETLEKIKVERATPADDPALIAEEQGKLFAANPEWFSEEGKTTEVYSKDIALMNDYAIKAGFSDEEFSQMTRAHYMNTILKAAKYDQLQKKGNEIKATREKVPVVTKPKAQKQAENSGLSRAEKFYGKTAAG